ncbi:SufS family cysteine desulfurase [Colwellia psychrerythraea]|uniref:cysteine desulfurase n=1 Tax=Colwellia psychrerythraea TaxID=28229 RepID=A0A099KBP2_COLPS|nr:SufS family cysteine desulfurase [Colwellia psychrerythraea]KGJ87776.1 cysteine desulfurase, SufS subfamily [Colwellia psychrerythraea]
MNLFVPQQFRQKFPLITRYAKYSTDKSQSKSSIVYFDNAATTQKPEQVIACQQRYYGEYNANVHRASHQLSTNATFAFEKARTLVQKFIGANSIKEIIWTKGTTESINLVVQSLARNTLTSADEIVLCASEHHANIVPWQIVAEQTGAVIKILPLNEQGFIDVSNLDEFISKKTKFVACAHISNVLGRINPIKAVIAKAKSVGAISLIDGAQAVAHIAVDVRALDCDFYVFSAHKMYGPTGIGVLYGKQALLENMPPYQGGGEMIKTVSFTQTTTFNSLPFKFEAGTPNIAAVIGFGESITFLAPLLADIQKGYNLYEQKMVNHCYQELAKIAQVNFIVEGIPDIGVIAFTIAGHHNHDVATSLDASGIAIRSGHHCAMPLMAHLNIDGCLRVSLAAYNTIEEIDYFINCLREVLLEDFSQAGVQVELQQKNHAKTEQLINLRTKEMKDIITLFTTVKGWDSRHREIMLLGKNLPRMEQALRNEQTIITGCESLAWLKVEQTRQGVYFFSADSDAKIIRGLLVIVLAAFNHKTAEQIHNFDIKEYFNQLGLIQHLSPSRGNGLLAIVDKIKLLAKE